MRARAFVLVCGRGPIGIGRFDSVPWHKKEKDDLIKELDLKIEYGEMPDYGNEARNTVGDFEHGNIIRKRCGGASMHRIAEAIHRSSKTIMDHIHTHNEQVSKRGYLVRCRRIRNEYATVEA